MFYLLRESAVAPLSQFAINQFDQNTVPTADSILASVTEPAKPLTKPIGDAVDFIVRRNDTLERIFRQLSLNLDDLATIRSLPAAREHVDALKPGELITLVHVDGALQRLARRISETATLSVTRDDSGFEARVVATPLDIRTVTAHGIINSSLFESGRAAGLSSDVVLRLANDIFGWDIDFALEIQPGDQFSVVYEQKYRDGHYVGDGKILAAEFINAGHLYRAVRFESSDQQVAAYFTPAGKSMHKQFLRAPVDFKYISSNFNPRRFHPILNIVRAHQGVDYAAPTGTPIKAAGNGRVAFVGVKGGYGRAIIIEHGGNISTLYGHMSRFGKDIRMGSRVQQGELIGYVGQTGTATASHLHYEYRVNGTHKNPRTVALPDALPISPGYAAEFEKGADALLAQLDRAKATQVAAMPSTVKR